MNDMKRIILLLSATLFATAAFVSCTEEVGTEPGNDSEPSVIIYTYEASRPNNPDNDVVLRFAANSQTTEAYYLAELTADKESRVASLGESGYMDYVVSNGTKISGISGASSADVTVTDLYGAYTITVVAVGGGAKTSREVTFTGLAWEDVVSGTYYFGVSNFILASGMTSTTTTMQVCTTDSKLFRLKDLYGSGYSLKINLLDQTGMDGSDEYTFFRVPVAETPFTYGSYGAIGVRDVGYWQGNDAYVTDYGYESGMYADYSCFLCVEYYVDAGYIGYSYDYFIPSE